MTMTGRTDITELSTMPHTTPPPATMTTPRSHDAESASRPEPRLDVRTPFLAGALAVLGFAGIAAAAVTWAPVAQGVRLDATVSDGLDIAAIASPRSGIIAKVHAVDGDTVAAGDLLISLETRAIDEDIAAMRANLEASRKQLELVRLEAQTMTSLSERKIGSDDKVHAMQTRLTEVERETATLVHRIAIAEADLDRSAIRAPTAGRVKPLASAVAGAPVQAGNKLVEVTPAHSVAVLEGRVPAAFSAKAGGVREGQIARVIIDGHATRHGKVAAVSEVITSAANQPRDLDVRIEIPKDDGANTTNLAFVSGTRAAVLIETGRATVLQQWQQRQN